MLDYNKLVDLTADISLDKEIDVKEERIEEKLTKNDEEMIWKQLYDLLIKASISGSHVTP
jgi:hypothetical protein